MKKFFTIAILLCAFVESKTQEMSIGKNFLNIGIGYPSHYWISWYSSGTPALKVSIDHGFRSAGPGIITLGGAFGLFQTYYNSFYYENFNRYDYTETFLHTTMAFRATYYYNLKEADIPEMNIYGGATAGIGYYFYSIKYTGPGTHIPNRSSKAFPIMGIFIGANYFLSNKVALFLEFGYDVSYGSFGVTFNM